MDSPFAADDVRALTRSEHLLLWGFRVVVHGRGDCPALSRAFRAQCSGDAHEAMAAFKALVLYLGCSGKRRLRLHAPGCIRASADELSLVAAFAAAQESLATGDEDRVQAHLAWLMGAAANDGLILAAQTVAAAMAAHGGHLPLREHDRAVDAGEPRAPLRVVH